MNDTHEHTPLIRRLEELELRIQRVETALASVAAPSAVSLSEPAIVGPAVTPAPTEDELEFEVGRNWFAKVGVGVLAISAGFSLTLPYAGLPAWLPSIFGGTVAAILFVLARKNLPLITPLAVWLRGSAMFLLLLAALRLFYFSPQPVLATDSVTGRIVLSLAAAFNLAFAWHRRSPSLLGLAIGMGCVTALAVGTAGFVLPSLLLLAGVAVAASARGGWPALGLVGVFLGPATYFLWSEGNPQFGRPFQFVTTTAIAPVGLLMLGLILGVGPLFRRNRTEEDGFTNSNALLNCALTYGAFLVHTGAIFRASFAAAQAAASLTWLALAVLFWAREQSRVSTFLYAMTGYLALSLAIIKAAPAPGVFVWLSLQSVVVVATAVWFRSRFIVVANFLIYVAIVLAYMVVAEHESGISLGFGIVALISARILNWQRHRLELKTELMRNAYLGTAFILFPYAFYHLAPGRYVGLAWVGLALFYYAMNLVVRNQKFRWMGHATLLLTVLYVGIVGTSRFGPVLRVLSLLALGTVMLAVSLTFTRMRPRERPIVKPD